MEKCYLEWKFLSKFRFVLSRHNFVPIACLDQRQAVQIWLLSSQDFINTSKSLSFQLVTSDRFTIKMVNVIVIDAVYFLLKSKLPMQVWIQVSNIIIEWMQI